MFKNAYTKQAMSLYKAARRALKSMSQFHGGKMIEPLEGRRLLTSVLTSGALAVTGSDNDDVINLTTSGTNLQVEINGVQETFAVADVTSIVVDALGGNDNVSLFAGVISSRVNGGAGDDTLRSGPGNDTLAGGAGDDTYDFHPNWGIDSINESAAGGTDTMDFTNISANLLVVIGALSATDGHSSALHGSTEIENIKGGSGDDTFFFQDQSSITGALSGGLGNNALFYTQYTTGVTVDLLNHTATGAGSINSIDNVVGGMGNDNLKGNANANTLSGGLGDDTLDGGAGGDTYLFGATWGHDTISEAASAGSDTLDFSGASASLTFTLATGAVTDGTNTLTQTGEIVENLVGGTGNDKFVFAAGAVNPGTIDGGAGSNTLDYSAYITPVAADLGVGEVRDNSNVLLGYFGTATGTVSIRLIDNVLGGSANDVLAGNPHANQLDGGAGNDNIDGKAGNDNIHGRAGNDTIQGSEGNDTLNGDGGDDSMRGSSGNDSMNGGGGNDNLNGDSGNDKLFGSGGNDTITGGSGSDLISGGKGIDNLFAKDKKKDTVDGGAAADIVQSDAGKDVLKNI